MDKLKEEKHVLDNALGDFLDIDKGGANYNNESLGPAIFEVVSTPRGKFELVPVSFPEQTLTNSSQLLIRARAGAATTSQVDVHVNTPISVIKDASQFIVTFRVDTDIGGSNPQVFVNGEREQGATITGFDVKIRLPESKFPAGTKVKIFATSSVGDLPELEVTLTP